MTMDLEMNYQDYTERTQSQTTLSSQKYYQKVINELIETEKSYVQDLKDICEVYIPCIKHLDTMSDRDLYIIFHNIRDIYTFSRELLEQLEETGDDVEAILGIFCQNSRFNTVYTPYCTNYPRANSKWEQAQRQHNIISVILRDLQSSLGHALPLESYLHKPVQRILKYHLLLKNLHDNLDGDILYLKDRAFQAYTMMSDCARVINESKRINDMDVETRNLHRFLIDSDTKEYLGHLLREAEMNVYDAGRTDKVKSNVYLFDKMIVICYRERTSALSIKNIIKCKSILLVEEIEGQPKMFSLVPVDNPSRAVYMETSSLTQKLDWCIQIEKLTGQNVPTKAKKLLISPPTDSSPPRFTPPSSERRSRSSLRSIFIPNRGMGRQQSTPNTANLAEGKLKKGFWRSLTSIHRLSRRSSSCRRLSTDDESRSSTSSCVSSDAQSTLSSDADLCRSPSAISRGSMGTESISSVSSELSSFFSRLAKRLSRTSLSSDGDERSSHLTAASDLSSEHST